MCPTVFGQAVLVLLADCSPTDPAPLVLLNGPCIGHTAEGSWWAVASMPDHQQVLLLSQDLLAALITLLIPFPKLTHSAKQHEATISLKICILYTNNWSDEPLGCGSKLGELVSVATWPRFPPAVMPKAQLEAADLTWIVQWGHSQTVLLLNGLELGVRGLGLVLGNNSAEQLICYTSPKGRLPSEKVRLDPTGWQLHKQCLPITIPQRKHSRTQKWIGHCCLRDFPP